MSHRTVACLLALFALASAAAAGPLEGRWVLVEETYGTGGLNLLRDVPGQTLEFVREGGGLAGRTRLSPAAPERPWPAYYAEDAARPVTVHEMSIPPREDRVRVRYRTPAARADQIRLDVVEDYRVSEDGASLVGTVEVTFLLGDETRGSFVLHRRFERRP